MTERRPNPALAAQIAATGLPEAEALAKLGAAEVAAGRSCGPCAQCCVLVGVAELDNAPGITCPHQREPEEAARCGGACSIHPSRPAGCRVYACAWKLGLGEDRDRPDHIHALLEWLPFDDEDVHPYGGYWLLRIQRRRPSRRAREVVEQQLQRGCVVLVHRGPGARLSMYYPDGAEDAEAGVAPSWEDERAGVAMDFRVAYYASYADALDPELRVRIETGVLPLD